jgi:hypothetical protein
MRGGPQRLVKLGMERKQRAKGRSGAAEITGACTCYVLAEIP